MNYNKVVNFEKVPAPKMRRSVIEQLFKNDLTAQLGKIIPVMTMEVTPGSNFDIKAMSQVRLLTPFRVPNFDNLEASFYWFFTPYRLCWFQFENFLAGSDSVFNYHGGNPDDWDVDVSGAFDLPYILVPTSEVIPGSIWDYMGVPVLPESDRSSEKFIKINNGLPFGAINLIFNEYFRDENLDNSIDTNYVNNEWDYSSYFLLSANKKRDVFTTSLIKPQKGNALTFSLGSIAPVVASKDVHESGEIRMYRQGSLGQNEKQPLYVGESGNLFQGESSEYTPSQHDYLDMTNLVADLSSLQSIDVSQLRILVQCQRFMERLAYGGSRYGEIIYSFFGTNPGDNRLQRPEFLGMSTIDINTQEVVQTSSNNNTDLFGSTGARSNSIGNAGSVHKAFTEFGVIQCLMVIRQKTNTYQQGLKPLLDTKTRLDFYWPVFSHISYQPVKNKFIYCLSEEDGENWNNESFGFNEPYIFLKTMPNEVHGDMLTNSGASSLDYWHYADYYDTNPYLGSQWLKSTDSNLRRALLIPSGSDTPVRPFAVNFRVKAKVTSLIPINSEPGYLDHF